MKLLLIDMNRNIHILLLLFLSPLFLLSSCMDELNERQPALEEGEGWLYFNFISNENVEVSTKSTLNDFEENAIRNIYVFIFDAQGNKVYGDWLESGDQLSTEDEVKNATMDCWYANNSSTAGAKSKGCMKIKASAGSGFKIYLFSNLNADMVKVSSDLLAHNISNEDDLKNFKVYMNVYSINRNGYFPMTGYIDGVNIEKNAVTTVSSPIPLTRLDAKVKFVFRTGDRPDAKGQKINSFTAKQWRVINVPVSCYAVPNEEDAMVVSTSDSSSFYYQSVAPYFFDTEWRNVEEVGDDSQSFSFYMLENRQSPKSAPPTYNLRSRQSKTAAGLNNTLSFDYETLQGKTESKEMRLFKYANDFSTYVLVTGRVDMTLETEEAEQTLGADVQYLIHLGNWNSTISDTGWQDDTYTGYEDYKTERNHFYTYTVTVNSVNNIRVEVEEGTTENQPGATGEVIIAKEEIAICDAHYVSKTLSFHAKNFYTEAMDGTIIPTSDNLTWKVKTPFSEGGPIYKDGVDISDHLDYNWVHFRLNKKDNGSYYSDRRRKYTPRVFEHKEIAQSNTDDDGTEGLYGYHNDGCMDIKALVSYIKNQVELYVDYRNKIVAANGNTAGITNESDFDNGKNVDGTEDPMGPKICVTVFVDEYYYDVHPISKVKEECLWKQFVNQPDRTMHILCDSYSSTDLESTSTGSVITIQQKSIKTIYNTDMGFTDLSTAWGVENVDEFGNSVKYYNDSDGSIKTDSEKNNDPYNGRANSVFEWGLGASSDDASTIEDLDSSNPDNLKWDKYLDIEVDNDTPQMKADYKALRYFCMARNRDNNGDGKISRDEVQWYLASVRQLVGLYVGKGLLEQSARLYYRTSKEQSNSGNEWKQMVISSTSHSETGKGPIVIWAQEGLSTSSYGDARSWQPSVSYGIRCVRNLGFDRDVELKATPQDFVKCEQSDDKSYYTFTCTYLNDAALRDYNSGELIYADENSSMNQLYKKFETAPTKVTYTSVLFNTLNDNVTNVGSSYLAGYCPEGYRLPNQVELSMMVNYSAGTDGMTNVSRTYWSFGVNAASSALRKDANNYGFFVLNNGNMTVDNKYSSTTTTRCVRDVRVD